MDIEKILIEKENLIKTLTNDVKSLKEQVFELAQKLNDSEKFKSHFISNVTNELINPVSSILGFAYVLKNIDENTPIEKIKNYASYIYNEAFDINFQLKNIFAAANFEAGKFDLQPTLTDLEKTIHDVIDDYEHLLNQKQISVNFSSSLTEGSSIITDVDKLKLVISNLLNNAIMFSYPNSEIIVKLYKLDHSYNISIRDFGIGLHPDFFDKVFERFYRIDNTINSQKKGTGLGLTVCKNIANLLNGYVYFLPQDKGTEVVFTFKEIENPEIIGKYENGLKFSGDDQLELF